MADVDPLSALWAARTVAVVGASERPGTPGRQVLEYLSRFGYPGRIVPVNPKIGPAGSLCGLPAYPSVLASGVEIDLAVVLVPAATAASALADCAAARVRVAIVGSSGFAETGPAGRARQDELVSIARSAGMRLVGPNCIGSVGPPTGLVASFSPLFAGPATRLHPGPIGFVSQSGALGYGAVSLALERGMGLLAAVTTGNEADVTALEVLAALAVDPGCAALLGYVESLTDQAAIRAVAGSGKPAALLVAGRSSAGARAAASHTGALTTADRVADGALRQLGIARASDVDELLDFGDAFALAAAPRGPRVAVVTTSGGSGILAADAVEATGLRLAELAAGTMDRLAAVVPDYGSIANPVDVTATVMRDPTMVGRCLDAVAADDGVDILVLCFCVLVGDDVTTIVDAIATVSDRYGKPVLVARTGADHLAPAAAGALREARVPVYPTPGRAVRAAAATWIATRPRQVPGRASGPASGRASGSAAGAEAAAGRCPAPAGALTEPGLKALLATAGVPVPRGTTVTEPATAAAAVAACGGRAVLKVVSPGLVHKSDAGGVVLGVGAERAEQTTRRLLDLPGATGVLVEEQVGEGVEVLVGIATSPLGRVLTIGAGGLLTEVLDDVACCLLPVTGPEVRAALAGTRVDRLLAGYRGRPAADVDSLIRLVLAVTTLAGDWPGALDLNPVVVTERGSVVLDAAYVPQESP